MRPTKYLFPLGLAAALVAATLIAQPQVEKLWAEDKCDRLTLVEAGSPFHQKNRVAARLGWVTSASFAGEKLFLVDVPFRRVAQVSRPAPESTFGPSNDGWVETLSLWSETHAENSLIENPDYIAAVGDRFALLDRSSGRIHLLDSDGQIVDSLTVRNRTLRGSQHGDIKLVTVRKFAALGSSGILAYADFQGPEFDIRQGPNCWDLGTCWAGFTYLGFDNTFKLPEDVESFKVSKATHLLHLRDFSFMASLQRNSSVAFAMKMSPSPKLLRFELGESLVAHEMLGFQDNYECPSIEQNPVYLNRPHMTPYQLKEYYETIENASMPVGLFSTSEDRLFVVSKDAIDRQSLETDWWVSEVDLASGALSSRILLPTKAAHLNMVSGYGTEVGLIEKGTARMISKFPRRALYRDITALVVMSEDVIHDTFQSRAERISCARIE